MVARMNAALVKGMQSKEIADRFNAIGATVHTSTPEEFAALHPHGVRALGRGDPKAGIKAE